MQKLGNIACGFKCHERLVAGRGIACRIGRCTRKRALCLQFLQRKCSVCVLADVDGQRFVDAGRWHHDLAPFAVRQEDGLDGAAGHVVVRSQRGGQRFQVRVGERRACLQLPCPTRAGVKLPGSHDGDLRHARVVQVGG